MDESRTEEATPRKLARARERGLLPRSPDLLAAGGLLALVGSLVVWGARLEQAIRILFTRGLNAAAVPAGPSAFTLASPLREFALLSCYPLCAIALAVFLAGFVQIGPLFSSAAFTPDVRRLDPAQRLRALLSAERFFEIGFGFLKFCALSALGASVLWSAMRGLLGVALGDAAHAVRALCVMGNTILLRIGILGALLGAVDLAYRHLRHRHMQRMSRRELQQEQRESYGVPELRERRQRLQQEAMLAAALGDLETASVLLLDGAGRAVALGFDVHDEKQRAPRIVAKAQGPAVPRLLATAEQRGIRVCVHPALVGVLSRLELTETIAPMHYAAVADVMRMPMAGDASGA